MPEPLFFDYGMRPAQKIRFAFLLALFAGLGLLAAILTGGSGTVSLGIGIEIPSSGARVIFGGLALVLGALAFLMLHLIEPDGNRGNALRILGDRVEIDLRGRKPVSATLPYDSIEGISKTSVQFGTALYSIRHRDGVVTLTNSLFDSKSDAERFISLLEQKISPV